MSDAYTRAEQIRKALKDITGHWAACLQPVRRGAGSRVQTSGAPPLPISANVLDARAMCLSRMAGWCRVVMDDRDLHTEGVSGLDVHAMADLLTRHADWLGNHEAAEDVVTELEASAKDLRGIAVPHRREWMSLGTCPLEVEAEGLSTPCLGTIRAYEHRNPYCDNCGVAAEVSWWERLQFPDAELSRLVTAPDLVRFVHAEFGRRVQEATIRQWLGRGLIASAGHDDKGRTLYDKASVAYAITRRKVVA